MLTDDDNIITIQLQNIYQNQLNLHILGTKILKLHLDG